MTLLLRNQVNLMLLAVGFFTRLPVPAGLDFSQRQLNQASRYFALVGWLVGVLCAAGYWIAAQWLPPTVAVLLSMLLSLRLTGCFHEDGLADTCDGFGGGWDARQKLTIMKDSRIGTYGAAALWGALTLKLLLLEQLAGESTLVIALLIAHPLSRAMATSLIHVLPYVADIDASKSKPLAESAHPLDLWVVLVTGALALGLMPERAVAIAIAAILVTVTMAMWMRKQIGGFTGDTLGATQQLVELSVYLLIVARGSL